MKKNYTTKIVIAIAFMFSCISSSLNAQMYYLPDTNFRNCLINQGFGSCITGDSIDSGCPLVANASVVAAVGANIHSVQGIQAFGSLTDFGCWWNLLTSLPPLPASLQYLHCELNQITALPALPASLVGIDCSDNSLLTLPVLPPTLTYLYCQNNHLTSLPALPGALETLDCSTNFLTSVPALPASLTWLKCKDNNISSLPVLPVSLTVINTDGNPLTSLPALPQSLTHLWCDQNLLTSIPVLPDTLIWFACTDNYLTALPVLPAGLTHLYCYNNQLTSLPSLPGTLTDIWCDHNQLTSIPELPDSLEYFHCNDNPYLTCLPQLKQIMTLDFSNTAVRCLPDYGNVYYSTPLLQDLPLCGWFNPDSCSSFTNISGMCFFDAFSNCVFDSADSRQQNMHIMLYKYGSLIQQAFTGGEGFYSFDVNDSSGIYSVQLDTGNIPFTVLCPVSINYNDTITAVNLLFSDNDFAMKCKATGFDLGAWSIEALGYTPAHNTTVHIQAGDISNFYGAQCANGVSGTVTIMFTGPVSYVSPDSGALAPSSVLDSTLIYNIADFGAVNLFTAFNIVVVSDTNAALTSQVCFTVSVSSLSGDNDTNNNTLTQCFGVVGSFDPNDKQVYPPNDIDPAGNRWLTYTIHFQNTGTAPAEYIYIIDELDPNLDLFTFQLLAYSHQPIVQILDGGIARFNFPSINLPDSNSNEPASHGYVQYKIKLKNTAGLGTQISNTAYIYFDLNAPVVTNTTLNTLALPTGIPSGANNNLLVSVYPNPSHSGFTISCPQFISAGKIYLKLFDVVGKEILSERMTSANFQLHTAELHSGIYFLKIESENGMTMKKLVKE